MVNFNSVKGQNINLSSIKEFDSSALIKIFNHVEDLCYVYPDSTPSDQKEINKYISQLGNLLNKNKTNINKNKNSFNKKVLDYLKYFEDYNSSSDKIDFTVNKIIDSDKIKTINRWMQVFKSTDMFYTIQGKFNDASDVNITKIFDKIVSDTYKSIKTEKVGCYNLYIISGEASKDYSKGDKPKDTNRKASKSLGRNLDVLAPSGMLDGSFHSNEHKIALFATSNLDVSSQKIAVELSRYDEICFVTTAMFNQSYSPTQTEFNGKKAQQHGSSFLKQFNGSVDFNSDDLGLFNVLPIMSLLNNVSTRNNSSYSISDITKINPFVIGTDTFFLYKDFRDIRALDEPEKTEELLNYYVSFIEKVSDKLSNINDNFEMSDDVFIIFDNLRKTILGVQENFNKTNLSREIPNDKILNSLFKSIDKFNKTINKVNFSSGNTSKINNLSSSFRHIGSKQDLKKAFERINENIEKSNFNSSITSKIKLKKPITKKNLEKLNFHLIDAGIGVNNSVNIIKLIASRQLNVKDVAFSSDALDQNTYAFFTNKRKDDVFKDVFEFIENNSDFNNSEVIKNFTTCLDKIKLKKINIKSINRCRIDECWNILLSDSDKNFSCPSKIKKFYNKIKSKKQNGISIEDIIGGQDDVATFFKTNIINRSSGYKSNTSYYARAEASTEMNSKPKYSSKMLEILGLYKYNCRTSLSKVIKITDIEDRINSFILEDIANNKKIKKSI